MADEFAPQDEPQADGPSTPEPEKDASQPEAALPAAISASDEDGDGVVSKDEVHVTDASDDSSPDEQESQAEVPAEDEQESSTDEPVQEGQGHVPTAQETAGSEPVPEATDPPEADDAVAPTVATQAIVDANEPPVAVQPSPETLALPEEQRDEILERAVAEEGSVSDLPPSQQAEAAGKTGQAESDAEYRRQHNLDAETPLQQRPASEQDEQTYSPTGVLTDDGTRIDPGDYHKPGAALPPETERDQDGTYASEEDLLQARVDKYEGLDEVPEDVQEARERLQVEVGDFDNDGDTDIREVEDDGEAA